MKILKITMMAILALSLFAGCKKDEKSDCEKLEGKWQCTSWKEDGVQYFGSLITSSNLDLDKLDGDQGDFDWQIFYFDGTSETIFGEYEVNQSCTEISVQPDGDIASEFDFTIDGEELFIEGNIDGTAVELEFELD